MFKITHKKSCNTYLLHNSIGYIFSFSAAQPKILSSLPMRPPPPYSDVSNQMIGKVLMLEGLEAYAMDLTMGQHADNDVSKAIVKIIRQMTVNADAEGKLPLPISENN